ncbi:phenol soluble modulin beta 1 [Staphylococcus epidermidis Scl25]|uniref:Phenol soluble modulin beta 1 n=2 Tax=Staphylococcus epidermidis TaxID=1282 RepID=Q5HQ21_STAEQ|nr:phenol soluble modulin beta 1 [Staphylococcus epidermidis RP62A]ESR05170.1 phenol soluble modulin beta 1 [Staphylococcus epidermidis CIM28]ESR21983.1 phenol soluble modulin beta 1 [Staphylococcus epidermidis APO35]EST95358.1 phenol soluble modulin beta 1 [Staphylococcus epidermidis Scl31]EST99893.1 phenol soluble modulin beta 1 [Staphylococcus epidermidis Scl25]ESU03967.1 phenol soluble modulin beta 1 [Staphylococcus epidermidis CIM37]ESV09831.1 phenol soluble modulin beta 1 [Staphylococcu
MELLTHLGVLIMKLFNAFKDILEAAITNDGTQLGASIVNIIESSVDMVNRFLGN